MANPCPLKITNHFIYRYYRFRLRAGVTSETTARDASPTLCGSTRACASSGETGDVFFVSIKYPIDTHFPRCVAYCIPRKITQPIASGAIFKPKFVDSGESTNADRCVHGKYLDDICSKPPFSLCETVPNSKKPSQKNDPRTCVVSRILCGMRLD